MAIRTIQTRRRKVDEALAWSGTAVAAATVLGVGAVAVLGTAVQQVVLRPDPPPRVVAEGGSVVREVDGAGASPSALGLAAPLPGIVLLPVASGDREAGGGQDRTGGGRGRDPERPGPGPGPGPQPPRDDEGPVSAVVDPVVEDVTGAVDDTTGSGTAPVTGPVRGTTDEVTDVLDGLVGDRGGQAGQGQGGTRSGGGDARLVEGLLDGLLGR